MQTLIGILIYVSVLATGVPTGTNQAVLGHATLTRDILVPGQSDGALPVVRPGEEYNCITTNHYGYILTCRDSDNAPRVALLRFCDAWGHATAKSWTHNAPMKDNTIVVKSTLPLLPTDLLLREGERHPVVKMGSGQYTIRYGFRDFEVDAPLAKADVEYEPPPPPGTEEPAPDPVKTVPETLAGEMPLPAKPEAAQVAGDAAAAPQPDQVPAPAVDAVPLDPLDEPPPPPLEAPAADPALEQPAQRPPAAAEPAPPPIAPMDPLDELPPPPVVAEPPEPAPQPVAPVEAAPRPAEPAPPKPTPAQPEPVVPTVVKPAPAEAAPAPDPEPDEPVDAAPAKPKPTPEPVVEVALAKPVQEPEPAGEAAAKPKAVDQPDQAAAPQARLPAQVEEIPAEVIVPVNQPGRITIEWWGDKAKPYVGDDGLLHVEVEPGDHRKTFVTILLGKAHQLFLGDLFSFDIDNSDGAASQVSLALMPRGQYYESMTVPLKSEEQNIVIDLADETFKCEKTKWENTTTLPLPALASRLTIVVYTKNTGEIVLSNVRFAAPDLPPEVPPAGE